jgi:oxepin-CoA hydrolase/3-oxo-5,6-dehydrosuberyl-CoA semialdehyde dehydrogenase
VWRSEQAEPEHGYYVAPRLYRTRAGKHASFVHEHEVFGPVATVLTWSGDADEAVEIVAAGGGGLVTSLYTDDEAFGGALILGLAPWHGRLMWGSRKVFDQSPGPGTVLPDLVHGGPGKAGGGEELGGARGLRFYLQRTAVQADRVLLERLLAQSAALPS